MNPQSGSTIRINNPTTAAAPKPQTCRHHLQQIVQAALQRVDPYQAIHTRVTLCGDLLRVNTEDLAIDLDLSHYGRILLLGAGKATAPMARAFEELLGERIDTGLICVKEGHLEALQRTEVIEASHPVPDQRGLDAARRFAQLANIADEKTLIINCLSGGASALLPYPLELQSSGAGVAVSLADKQILTRLLLGCGAPIDEINCVRKHLSAIKGGHFLRLAAPARSLNFILSDVVGDDLSSIASGLTSADPTTFSDAINIIDRYQLRSRTPASILAALELGLAGTLAETPKEGDHCLSYATNILIGTNHHALLAAEQQARQLGYHTRAGSVMITGEARHAARYLATIAREVAASDLFMEKPACLLFGGETVVTLQGNGKGGRNQELALAFLQELSAWGDALNKKVFFLSAATDGNDGPTDAAGAFADAEVLSRAKSDALEIDRYLGDNDSYHFFEKVTGLLMTGPTNTNVGDLQIILIY
ncbi:glycerate kinase type-2 family protein [Pelovirga terrestris]|uniref:Glycerate kinase n=1 Tax=Pelovirga terrestris TaxID=2771352 RepID=A0A8J6UGZ8_9BACT|nr:glycerate kinase [Pelovirga terrestris]MBD1400693.1 glycerate kinase [Pelovirga terrestris]